MDSPSSEQNQYTVVARRYRPQSFVDLVGQQHVSQALANAIKLNRVGHAYLFTGARGVGKTSSARIFAKCLNCSTGPSATPCNECDVCQTVSIGEDIDVLEIDGASNRGIDEIRQLRSNAIVRPSRSRFKIYIIDEVHMLTQQAFNALLKTLEEPPDHVKFIFCTTDPQKIPITVLSRCQRFDFSPVQTPEIINRLSEICKSENIEADAEALSILARRAGGSMRDSQSLLEQLFSFCDGQISTQDVHQLLGTADSGRIAEVADALIESDAAKSIDLIANAIEGGVDAGQLANQLLGYFRDIMTVRVGASADALLFTSESDVESLTAKAEQLGLEKTLSIVQLLDHCITRMQSSMHSRTLMEVAIVRICNLQNLDLVADLANQLSSSSNKPAGKKPAATAKKKQPEVKASDSAVAEPNGNSAQDTTTNVANGIVAAAATTNAADALPDKPQLELKQSNLQTIWQQSAGSIGGMAPEMAGSAKQIQLNGQQIQVTFSDRLAFDFFQRSDRFKTVLEAARKIAGNEVSLEFKLAENQNANSAPKPKLTRVQMIRQLEQHELVKNAIEVFDAEIIEFHERSKS